MSVRSARLAFVLAALLAPVAVAAPPASPLANQVPNGDFDTDTNGWNGGGGSFSVAFSPGPTLDAFGSPSSGSTRNGVNPGAVPFANGGSYRCVGAVTPGLTYDFGAWIRVGSGQACGGSPCTAQVFVTFYSNPNCDGQINPNFFTPTVKSDGSTGALDTWHLRTAQAVAPVGAASAWIYLNVVGGADGTGGFLANFDGARFGATPTLPVTLQEFEAE